MNSLIHISLSAILLVALLGQTPALASSSLPLTPTANWIVDSFLDEPDANPGVGGCVSTPSGSCTLRAAIMEANASTLGGDSISLPAGIYTLTIAAGPPDTIGANGDLDIIKNMTLSRSSLGQVMIDGNNLDRVFEVSATVSINQIVIRKGGGTGFFGVWVQPGANVTLTDGAVTDNNGAGIRVDSATVTLNNTAVLNNGGSGLLINGGSSVVNVNNTTISGNGFSGPNGGGIDISGGVLLLNNATIANNLGLVSGGLSRTGSATVLMQNTIIAGNAAPDCSGTLTSVAYSLIQNVSGCTIGGSGSGNLFGIDPLLGPLQDNGGRTLTHALGLASLAINAGDPNGCKDSQPIVLATDQRGTTRPQPQGGRCDMGAYEVPAVQFASTNFSIDESAGMGVVTATIDGVSALTLTVPITASNGTALAGSDYVTTTGTLTFPPNTLATTFTVPLLEDSLDEADETVVLTLGNPAGALLDTPFTATLTIVDNDLPPEFYLTQEDFGVDEDAGSATISANLGAMSGLTVTVNYSTTNGTALAGSDYVATSGTLTFSPGLTVATFNVPIINETFYEPDETLTLNLGNAVNALPGIPNTATLTIFNDDLPLLFLPFVGRNIFNCWAGPNEVEPNGSIAQAHGPLCYDGRSYNGGDSTPLNTVDWDYYSLQWPQTGQFTVRLTGVALGVGLQLQLYYQDLSTRVGYLGGPNSGQTYQMVCPGTTGGYTCTGAAGLYYILVYMPVGYNGSGYTLTVTTP